MGVLQEDDMTLSGKNKRFFFASGVLLLLAFGASAQSNPGVLYSWHVSTRTLVIVLLIAASLLLAAIPLYRITVVGRLGKAHSCQRRSNARLRSILDHTTEGIIALDQGGTIRLFNKAAQGLFGYTAKEATVLGFFRLIAPADGTARYGDFETMCRDQTFFGSGGKEISGQKKGGDRFPMTAILARVDDGGEPYYIAFLYDISGKKAIQQELERQQEVMALHMRLAAMGEMIGNIAHQWRQPLTQIAALLMSIGAAHRFGKPDETELDAKIATANACLEYLSETIDDFRSFFRPEKESRPFSLKEVLDRALSLFESGLKSYQIRIDRQIEPGGEWHVSGYPNELAQVLLNLLNNARDVIAERNIPRGVITLRLFTENGRPVLAVADNGGGIDPTLLSRIFDPYFTTKGPDLGTGVGLYMSKMIVEKHMHGSLDVRNTDTGAEFFIKL
jgi:PAS domain S-box-containing protein